MEKDLTKVLLLFICLAFLPTKSRQHIVNVSLVADRRTGLNSHVAEEVNSLGLRLLRVLSGQRKEENTVFSPFSIGESLRILLLGARGRSAQQISQALKIKAKDRNKRPLFYRTVIKALQKTSGKRKKDVQDVFLLSNKLWVQKGFPLHHKFKSGALHFLKADVESINFKGSAHATRLMNSWVERKTLGRLKDLLSDGDITMSTSILLMSTLYFKGQWKQKFNPHVGKKRDKFYVSRKKSASVKMMSTAGNFHFANCSGLRSKAVELPYAGDKNLTMVIILPYKRLGGMKDLQKKLNYKEFKKCLRKLDRFEKRVEVYLPRFRLREKLELSGSLKALGIKNVFNRRKVNLSGISSHKVFLSAVIHQADVKVDELGTKATAATAGEISERAIPKEFVADHPFLFFIREKTFGTVLFIGSVQNPSTE